MMKFIVFTLVILAVSVSASDDCMKQFNKCRISNVAGASTVCAKQYATCVSSSCTCLDVVSTAVTACTSNSSSTTQSCIANYQRNYASCISSCEDEVTEYHSSKANIVRFLGLPSKCDICTDIVGFIEGKGNDYACESLNLADVVPGCDVVGPVCGVVLDAVCSKVLAYVEKKTPISPKRICEDINVCGKNIVGHSSGHHVASIVQVTKKGAAKFLQQHAKRQSGTTAQCWAAPTTASTKRRTGPVPEYTCMEQPVAVPEVVYAEDVSAAATPAAVSHKSSDMAVGVAIGVVAAVSVFGIIAAVVVIRRRKTQQVENIAF